MAATGLGSGRAPLAPGTAGTLVGVPIYLVLAGLAWPLWLLSLTALTFLAWHAAEAGERLFGRDAPCIVIDEIAGLQWSLFLVAPTPLSVAAGFVLFRVMDIWKPFPARLFQERLPGGLGVVADDMAAAFYANLLLRLLIAWAT